MKILSISTHHDSNYCVFEDGKVLVHNELERFTRKKHDWSPQRLWELVSLDKHVKTADMITMPINYDDNLIIGGFKFVDLPQPKIFIGHHTAHAANVYYDSGFEDAIIYTMDGGGFELVNDETPMVASCVFIGEKNKISRHYVNDTEINNPGQWWTGILIEVFGLSEVEGERGDESGTLMAMAAMGDPYKYLKYVETIFYQNLKRDRVDGHINAGQGIRKSPIKMIERENKEADDLLYFLNRIAKKSIRDKYDLAAAVQHSLENYMISTILSFINIHPTKNICFSGGTMLNCIALGKVTKILKDKHYKVFCDQAPNDSGLSLGAAKYYYYNTLDNKVNKTKNISYLGKTYTSKSIYEVVDKKEDLVNVKKNVELEEVVDLITKQKIISVFNGGSESGKRALGNRSILADPRFFNIKTEINSKVKNRQHFRPFAPSVLREYVSDWFEFDIDSPYMSFAIPVKEDKRTQITAVLHVDGTSRLQTVTKRDNGYYYDLIKLFYDKTGIPMILNTSFNEREPIVETPEDGVNCFLRTNIDYMYFVREKLLLSKGNKYE